MIRLILAIVLSAGATGCSSLRGDSHLRKKTFAVKKTWIRPTLAAVSAEHRLSHRMTTLVLGDRVIQGNGNDGISAFARDTGRLLWTFPVDGGVEGGAQAVDGNLYFGGNDGVFYSITVAEGKLNWQFAVNAQVIAPPLINGKTVYFLSGNNTVFALAAADGQQKWLYRRVTGSMLSVRGGSRPAIFGGTLYLGMSDGYFVAIDTTDGKLIWERQLVKNVRFTDIDASPVMADDYIYVSSYDGSLYCLSRKDGQIVWRVDKGSHAAVTVVGEQLFYSTSEGEVLGLKSATGEQLWSYTVPEGIASRPKYFKGMVVFGESEGPLRFLSSTDGSPVFSFATGRGVTASPAIVDDTGEVFAISNEGLLFALHAGWFEGRNDWPWMR
jgi:outer membrane protein assembly factor BamB